MLFPRDQAHVSQCVLASLSFIRGAENSQKIWGEHQLASVPGVGLQSVLRPVSLDRLGCLEAVGELRNTLVVAQLDV